MSIIRFGAFELDPDGAELRKFGIPLKLPPQPFQVLALLVSKPGQLVTREQIQQEVWGHNSFNLDQGINSSISQIRSVLGDVADGARYIETVPRRGYRFIAPLAAVADDDVTSVQEKPAAPSWSSWRRSVQRMFLSAVALLIASAIYLTWRDLQAPSRLESSGPMMLVTLPFRNLDDGDDYFSDGLTEEIITQLGRLSPERFRVIAPTSAMAYKNSGKTVERIASELGVDYVLEGGVRRSGDRVRISVQLTDARNQTQLWSTSYERRLADVLEVQNELGRRVARSLALELMPEQQHAILARASTTNPAAYTSYLKGRYHLSRLSQTDLQASLSYFAEAIEKDPNYALAYVGLSDSYSMLGVHNWVPRGVALQEAKRATQEALSIDDTLGEAYASRGLSKYWFEWDWLGAERDFQRALALTPNYSTAHQWYGALLGDLGRFDQALEEGRQAQELDPRAQDVNLLMVRHLYHSRRMDEAMGQAQELVQMSPAFAKAHRMLGRVYAQKELYKEALREFEDAVRLSYGDPSYEAGLAYLHAVSDRRADAERMLASLKAIKPNTPAYEIARIYTALDAPDLALDWLDRAYEDHHIALTRLQVDPVLDELRSNPRYHELVEKMGFPPILASSEP